MHQALYITLNGDVFILVILVHTLLSLCHYKWSLLYKIKADRPHPPNYPHTPTDYRHTDKQESSDKQTDGRTLPSTLSPSFAVDNYQFEKKNRGMFVRALPAEPFDLWPWYRLCVCNQSVLVVNRADAVDRLFKASSHPCTKCLL